MFSRDDFVKYFKQVSDIENKMLENVEELLRSIKKQSLAASLERIRQDEVKHLRILKDIGKTISDGEEKK